MPVITMTGTVASGAREVGRRVATLLGIDFVDQQLMVQAAKRCGVPVGVVAERDERSASFRERLSGLFGTLLERSAASAAADPLTGVTGLEAVLSQTYADMARETEEKPFSDQLYLDTMSTIVPTALLAPSCPQYAASSSRSCVRSPTLTRSSSHAASSSGEPVCLNLRSRSRSFSSEPGVVMGGPPGRGG